MFDDPGAVVTAFYERALRDRDVRSALDCCSDDIRVRADGWRVIAAGNVPAAMSLSEGAELVRGNPYEQPPLPNDPRSVVEYLISTREDRWPVETFDIESVTISRNHAHVVSTDGSCGAIRRADAGWLMDWILP